MTCAWLRCSVSVYPLMPDTSLEMLGYSICLQLRSTICLGRETPSGFLLHVATAQLC